MKLVTILGTRPELIRLSKIIPKLDRYCDQILVHTGQNHDYELDKIFRDELDIRKPNYYLEAKGSLGDQLSITFKKLHKILLKEKPDAFLVLGDTNSSLGAIIAKRLGIRVFHMEAGNRCHDPLSPEEVNRKIIDHCSDIHMPYTELSRQNLLREGVPPQNIFVIGNPIREILPFPATTDNDYYLVTLHRQENVDNPDRLREFVYSLNELDKPVIWSVHPRTRKKLKGMNLSENIKLKKPLGFSKFIGLERNAYCVLTDSGTVQEECAIFGTPCVTLRDSTERPETIESGSNIIVGKERIMDGIRIATELRPKSMPEEYSYTDVSDRVVKIVCGYYR